VVLLDVISLARLIGVKFGCRLEKKRHFEQVAEEFRNHNFAADAELQEAAVAGTAAHKHAGSAFGHSRSKGPQRHAS
jgi:hypothetical protein